MGCATLALHAPCLLYARPSRFKQVVPSYLLGGCTFTTRGVWLRAACQTKVQTTDHPRSSRSRPRLRSCVGFGFAGLLGSGAWICRLRRFLIWNCRLSESRHGRRRPLQIVELGRKAFAHLLALVRDEEQRRANAHRDTSANESQVLKRFALGWATPPRIQPIARAPRGALVDRLRSHHAAQGR
jgi:hypothetical protein